MPERFRGELLAMGRYTNPASFTWRNVWVRLLKKANQTDNEGIEVMSSERLFQIRGPTTANDWSQTMTRLDVCTSCSSLYRLPRFINCPTYITSSRLADWWTTTGDGLVMACQQHDAAGRTGDEGPCREELGRRGPPALTGFARVRVALCEARFPISELTARVKGPS